MLFCQSASVWLAERPSLLGAALKPPLSEDAEHRVEGGRDWPEAFTRPRLRLRKGEQLPFPVQMRWIVPVPTLHSLAIVNMPLPARN
jgi:hypothetical protein